MRWLLWLLLLLVVLLLPTPLPLIARLLTACLLWLAFPLLAAVVQQLLQVLCCMYPDAAHPQSCMQQLVTKYPQRPRQPLVGGVAVGRHPWEVIMGCRREAPDQRIDGVIHRRPINCLQLL
jgi:hypothetical protein